MKKTIYNAAVMQAHRAALSALQTFPFCPRPFRRAIIKTVWPWRWLWYAVLLVVGFCVGGLTRAWVDWGFVFEAGRLAGSMGR